MLPNSRRIFQCFLISAFGTKTLLRNPSETIDFDHLQYEIKSAVEAYEQTHPAAQINIRRADEYFGGSITREFYEQLYKADLVIAEISSPNLNVYFELGARLALKRSATILLACEGTPLPFDIKDLRTVFYQPGKLHQKNAELHALMKARLDGAVDSPIYEALPSLQTVQRIDIESLEQSIVALQGIKNRDTYGFRITSPEEGNEVAEWVNVTGVFTDTPPLNTVCLLNKSPDETYGYWPQCFVEIDSRSHTWSGRVHFGGKPPEEGIITLATIGKAGRALWDYFMVVGKSTNQWPPIRRLTDDIFVCDSVRVTKTRRHILRWNKRST